MKTLAVIFAVIASLPTAAGAAPIYVDNFEQFSTGTDLTNATYTPTVGGTNATTFHSFGPLGLATVTAASANGSIASVWDLPSGSAEDYLGRFFTTYVEPVAVFTWDFSADNLNDGFGGFFIRFPTPTLDMQVLMGFLDDGRVIVFNDTPSPSTFDTVGSFDADVVQHSMLTLNLPANTYSVVINGTPLVTNRAIPPHINNATIHQFGFDSNEEMLTAQGNRFILDNVEVTLADAQVPEPTTLLLVGTGLVALRNRRRYRTISRRRDIPNRSVTALASSSRVTGP